MAAVGSVSPMAGSIRLFAVAGISVHVHWSWLVVAYFEIQLRTNTYTSQVWNIAEYLTLFGIVLLHEFGHALACRQVGGRANDIVLWPLGGIAFVSPPVRPGAVLWSIAAGCARQRPVAAVDLHRPAHRRRSGSRRHESRCRPFSARRDVHELRPADLQPVADLSARRRRVSPGPSVVRHRPGRQSDVRQHPRPGCGGRDHCPGSMGPRFLVPHPGVLGRTRSWAGFQQARLLTRLARLPRRNRPRAPGVGLIRSWATFGPASNAAPISSPSITRAPAPAAVCRSRRRCASIVWRTIPSRSGGRRIKIPTNTLIGGRRCEPSPGLEWWARAHPTSAAR